MRLTAYSALIILMLSSLSCDINSGNGNNSEGFGLTQEPMEAGTVDANGYQLRARSERGYLFAYWEITYDDGTVESMTEDTVRIEESRVDSVKGVFTDTDIEVPVHMKPGPDGRYAYFIKDFIMPVDSANRERFYAFVKTDISDATKEKVFITQKRIRLFDVSHDRRYLAFSVYSTSGNFDYKSYIADIETQETKRMGVGKRLRWAHNSNRIVEVWNKRACIWDLYNLGSCLTLEFGNESGSVSHNYFAASWSPDDSRVILSRDLENFYAYNSETASRQTISKQISTNFIKWLDNSSFVTFGKDGNQEMLSVVKYDLNDPEQPEILPLKTDHSYLDLSPDGARYVYINQGVNIYDQADNTNRNILNYYAWDPLFPHWVQNGNILFYDRNDGIPAVLYPSGRVFKL